jgi:hypothetical protein
VGLAQFGGVVIDALRCAKLALDRGIGGALIEPSSYFMKTPPQQFTDNEAREKTEAFIAVSNALTRSEYSIHDSYTFMSELQQPSTSVLRGFTTCIARRHADCARSPVAISMRKWNEIEPLCPRISAAGRRSTSAATPVLHL